MTISPLHTHLKHLRFISLLIRLSVYQTQAFLLGTLITFENNFHFNLIVIFMCNKIDLFDATCFIILRLGRKCYLLLKWPAYYSKI